MDDSRAAMSAVVLAGGRGQRLGGDKADIELVPGQTLLQRSLAQVSALTNDIMVVRRPDQALDAPCARLITDRPPYAGPLAGILAGLEAAHSDWSFVVACDMPFLNEALVRYMLTLRPDHDVVVPRLPVGLEPLHALYHRRAVPAIVAALERGERRLISFYGELRVRYVDPEELATYDTDGRAFFNINTTEDLARARAWLS